MNHGGTTSGAETTSHNSPSFLIVGGAEKAGTTSLYGYLAAHPEVCASLSKETDYFRGSVPSIDGYLRQFPSPGPLQRLRLESSPGYLAEAETAAPAIARTLPNARLVFVLRDPVERLRSCHRFYLSRLHLPPGTTLDEFAALCFVYTEDADTARQSGVLDWHLNALARGQYEVALQVFRKAMPGNRIVLVDYRKLARDPRHTVKEIAAFAGIEPSFYDTYVFARENVSFSARNRTLQRMAIMANDRLESLWRRYPQLKRHLLSTYKAINTDTPEPDAFSPSTLFRLQAFYAPTYAFLEETFGVAPQHAATSGP